MEDWNLDQTTIFFFLHTDIKHSVYFRVNWGTESNTDIYLTGILWGLIQCCFTFETPIWKMLEEKLKKIIIKCNVFSCYESNLASYENYCKKSIYLNFFTEVNKWYFKIMYASRLLFWTGSLSLRTAVLFLGLPLQRNSLISLTDASISD